MLQYLNIRGKAFALIVVVVDLILRNGDYKIAASVKSNHNIDHLNVLFE